MSDDGLVFGELLSANCEGDGRGDGRGDGDAADREDEDVVKTVAVTVVAGGVEDTSEEMGRTPATEARVE